MINKATTFLAFLLLPVLCFATDGTWEKVASGLLRYSDPLYWKLDVARGVGATANFNPRGGLRSLYILLDEDLVIGQMLFTPNFGATFQNSNTVHTITFDNGAVNSRISIPGDRVEVHFDVPLILSNNTTLIISKSVSSSRPNASRFTQPITGRGDISIVMSTAATSSAHSNALHFAQSLNITGGLALHGSQTTLKRPEFFILSAPNTYPGGTRVLSGKLSATAPKSLGTGDIVVGAYAELRLEATGATHPSSSLALFSTGHDQPIHATVFLGPSAAITNTVSTLHINGVKHPSGFYTAQFPETLQNHFTGHGVLRVTHE